MKLSGWTRLWLLFAISWIVLQVAFISGGFSPHFFTTIFAPYQRDLLWQLVALVFLPPLIALIAAKAILVSARWVRKGFTQQTSESERHRTPLATTLAIVALVVSASQAWFSQQALSDARRANLLTSRLEICLQANQLARDVLSLTETYNPESSPSEFRRRFRDLSESERTRAGDMLTRADDLYWQTRLFGPDLLRRTMGYFTENIRAALELELRGDADDLDDLIRSIADDRDVLLQRCQVIATFEENNSPYNWSAR